MLAALRREITPSELCNPYPFFIQQELSNFSLSLET
jgi:hypothetical protein